MAEGVTGLILAGGRSTRMGQDKARLPWGCSTLLEHVIGTLGPLVDELLIAVDDVGRFRDLPVRVVEDLVPGAHALGGLYTGLRSATHPYCFVCGCDAPFLNARLIRWLIAQADGFDAVIPRTREGLQPLHAVYARSALRGIEEQLRRQRWDLKALAMTLRVNVIAAEALHPFDPGGLSFVNLNTPEGYARACALQRGMTRVIDRRRHPR